MDENLKVEVLHDDQLTPEQLAEIHALCKRAYAVYDVDVEPLFRTFTDTTHVVGWWGSSMVSHAMWVTRWLQPGDRLPLRTAYVEMVATEPAFQGRGFAAAVMRRLAVAIHGFELGGLSPAEPMLYTKLGWVFWQGPLSIRTQDGLIPTPDGSVMILRLPHTPLLDLTLPLSAEWREGELW
jgi:aminoglycoside 2'-N-acetyltransferase I